MVDERFSGGVEEFRAAVAARAMQLAICAGLPSRLAEKQRRRDLDKTAKPLAQYRAEELARMNLNFYGFDPIYHVARYNFVHCVPKSHTPLHLVRHRCQGKRSLGRELGRRE